MGVDFHENFRLNIFLLIFWLIHVVVTTLSSSLQIYHFFKWASHKNYPISYLVATNKCKPPFVLKN
jgi:hypothetical protein